MVICYSYLSESDEPAAVEQLCKTGEGNEKRTDTRSDTGTQKGV